MCYVIENLNNYTSMNQMMITVEKNEDIELDYVTWRMTTDHDYLGVITRLVADFMPFKFEVVFGAKKSNKITLVETIKKPLKCKMYHPDYLSEQECLVYDFYKKHFSPCPVKCIPIQMRGFEYLNLSSDLKNCKKLEDEVCNAGPIVWKGLMKEFGKCKKPCKISSYDDSQIEKFTMTYKTDTKNEASFLFVNSDLRPIEKEVLLYDLSDVIGTVGGSLGVAVGISIFAVISCCFDNFLVVLNMFQRKKYKKTLFLKKQSKIPIYIGRINAEIIQTDPC